MINQLLPTMSYGDAVSNSAVNMMNVLRKMGVTSHIYAQNIHPKMRKFVRPLEQCPKDQPVIYHLSTGSDITYTIPQYRKEKMMVYHNVTPAEYFRGYNGMNERLCNEGREQLRFLAEFIDVSFADSEYNRQELLQYNYKHALVTPIIMNFEEYNKQPNQQLLNKLNDDEGYTNILFVGRIAPNKKQDDLIKSYYYYKKWINPKSRLFLVGSYDGMERYYQELVRLVKHLQLEDVYITGHIPFDHILAYYTSADLFLCMSEHEGFCVPLVEAMHFRIPIIAYNSSAIEETLGHAGFLTLDKDYQAIAELIHLVISNEHLQQKLKLNQTERLQHFSKQNTEKIFAEQISALLNTVEAL